MTSQKDQMTEQCCIYCFGQEDGKPCTVCSRCIQLIMNAKPEAVTAFVLKHKQKLTEQQLHYLQTTTDEVIHYDYKARKYRQNLARTRTGRTPKSARPSIRQMRAT
jgi:hypothetical protein